MSKMKHKPRNTLLTYTTNQSSMDSKLKNLCFKAKTANLTKTFAMKETAMVMKFIISRTKSDSCNRSLLN